MLFDIHVGISIIYSLTKGYTGIYQPSEYIEGRGVTIEKIDRFVQDFVS